MATDNDDLVYLTGWDDLQQKCINYGLGVMADSATADPAQSQIAVAVLGTMGPNPLGVEDYMGALELASEKALHDALKANGPAQGRPRSMPPFAK